MTENSTQAGGIKTADRTFDIIELLKESDEGLTTRELASELDIATSTAHEYLKTFERRKYVTKDDDGSYALSLKFLDYGQEIRERYRIIEISKQPLAQIAEETGEVAWLYVEEHGFAVPLNVAKGERAVQIVGRVGNWKPMHQISAGKAMLAAMELGRAADIIDSHGLVEATANTITDRDALFEELAAIRERGVAFNDSEEVNGIRAVGMAIETDGEIHGGFSVSGPSNRISDERFREELPTVLSGAVNEVELRLNYG